MGLRIPRCGFFSLLHSYIFSAFTGMNDIVRILSMHNELPACISPFFFVGMNLENAAFKFVFFL